MQYLLLIYDEEKPAPRDKTPNNSLKHQHLSGNAIRHESRKNGRTHTSRHTRNLVLAGVQ